MKQFIKCEHCNSVQVYDSKKWMSQQHLCTNKKCDKWMFKDEIEPLKALSIKQPWAWLIVNGYKDLENRKALKHLKGTFLIHAGASFDLNGFVWVKDNNTKGVLNIPHDSVFRDMFDTDFEKGGIVGYVEFNGSVQESDSPWFAGEGFNGLVITKAHTLPFVPCKGQQGVFYPEIA